MPDPVTPSISNGDLDVLAATIRACTRQTNGRMVRFVHIPHSRSWFNDRNNDCVTGEVLWSTCKMHQADREDLFTLSAFDPNPLSVLRTYGGLDGVMSARYHGLVFGRIAGIPTLAMGGSLVKLRSFIDDYPSGLLRVAERMDELLPATRDFLDMAERRWSKTARGTVLSHTV